ncbi:MAG: hypothetical protein AAGA46_03505 [Cyanobacteria bacterium P01_F01_bin.13]
MNNPTPCMLLAMALATVSMLGVAFYLWVWRLAFMGEESGDGY